MAVVVVGDPSGRSLQNYYNSAPEDVATDAENDIDGAEVAAAGMDYNEDESDDDFLGDTSCDTGGCCEIDDDDDEACATLAGAGCDCWFAEDSDIGSAPRWKLRDLIEGSVLDDDDGAGNMAEDVDRVGFVVEDEDTDTCDEMAISGISALGQKVSGRHRSEFGILANSSGPM
ncbi:hypothetical protein SISSUDRAFT_1030936 [Sistotremastrum suecicum HHB10207 ss-3]|uniref:Uncharacterized protein n=1 Tax=Sistotremastrum suecicum HHB10207 ss-3 TaxID=1314776 RepID=A0A166GL35_9AGAM|nr:hypothetical protein SISSUDRAFT_1030936 [Sistotremastrum suecicum HHB10207 ss-3]